MQQKKVFFCIFLLLIKVWHVYMIVFQRFWCFVKRPVFGDLIALPNQFILIKA